MDKKVKDGIITSTIVIVGSYLLYKIFYKKTPSKTKADYVNNIANKVKTNATTLSTFDLGFLQAWSDALDTNAKSFMYNGKNYDGRLGTAII